MRKFRLFGLSVQQNETSAHAQVRYQGPSIVEVDKDVFAAAVNEIYLCAGKPLVKFTRTNTRREKLPPKLGRFDRSIPQKGIETPHHDLYFRKLGHSDLRIIRDR